MIYDVQQSPPPDPQRVAFLKSRCLATGDSSGCPELSEGFAQTMYFLDEEDPEEFKKLLTGLHNEFKPASLIERIQVEHLAASQWMMMRFTRLQSLALRCSATQHAASHQRSLAAAERTFYRVRRLLLAAKKPKSEASGQAA